MKTHWVIAAIITLFFVQGCTAEPVNRPTTETGTTIAAATFTVAPTDSPTTTVTPVPPGVFALLFYSPLVLDYDPSVWKDTSNYTDTSMIVNNLQSRDLPTCTLGPQGASGNYPPADEIVKLGNIQYEFSSEVSEVTGEVIALYILNSEIEGDNPNNGLTKINVFASQSEWEQCKLLAEEVLSSLHASP